MEQIKRYRRRMETAFKELSQAMTPLVEAIEGQTTGGMISRKLLVEVRDKVNKLLEIQDQTDESTAQAGAAVGHLLEYEEEMAQLTTLAQYPEIAAQAGVNFIAGVLNIVEIPIYEQSLERQSDERLLLLEAATQRAVGKRRK